MRGARAHRGQGMPHRHARIVKAGCQCGEMPPSHRGHGRINVHHGNSKDLRVLDHFRAHTAVSPANDEHLQRSRQAAGSAAARGAAGSHASAARTCEAPGSSANGT